MSIEAIEQAEKSAAIKDLTIAALKDSDAEGWAEVRRLRALISEQAEKHEPVAWNENVDEMPFNTYCKAIVDWYSYATDGDSFLEGRDVEVIVVRYKLDEDEDDIVFIHKGNKQYAHTKCIVSKWKPLYTAPPKREWNELTVEELANEASQGEHAGEFALGAMWAAAVLKKKNHE